MKVGTSKAIFVMDMPENCMACPVINHCHNNDGKYDLTIRQSWCPLKPMPEKYNVAGGSYKYPDGYRNGWNDCIDSILGE